ncbi:MAG: 3-deoxy-manno-octulosonate cytidylyltransferase [Alistipes sp.]|nr:3-deoxy-manno-octulosonate cytidylyltransferase [Alistipes sp.]
MKVLAIIPARYASSRFPAKPLAMLGGKMVIERVYEQVAECVDMAVVATDDERILSAVESFGGKAVMTSTEHRCGTDRCREAFEIVGYDADYVINIQGDEPFISREHIELLKRGAEDGVADIVTLATPFDATASIETLKDKNSPKVVFGESGYALYFSRSVIPFIRDVEQEEWLRHHTFYKHIGAYAFRADVLKAIATLKATPLEKAESLEQLRWLESGYRIKIEVTNTKTFGIDTPEDLQRAEQYLRSQR